MLPADRRDYQIICFSRRPLTPWKVFSSSFTHFPPSCQVILRFLTAYSHPFPACVPDSLQVFLTRKRHAEVRTLASARTVTAGLNKTSFHPFIFNRKSQDGLELFANAFLQQVISYCAVLRLPPLGHAVVKILSPSFRPLSICFSPHRTSSCPRQIWLFSKTWLHWQSSVLNYFLSIVFYSWFKWNKNRNRSTPGFIFFRLFQLWPASLH